MSKKLEILASFNRPKIIGGFFFVVLLFIWLGIPEINKWRADKMVDDFCYKDSGIKIHEVIKLSASQFNKFGGIHVPAQKYLKNTDEYYYKSEILWIIPEGKQVRDMALWRYHHKIFRVEDSKLLAEDIGYSRRGGDAVGPWHPSHYGCVREPGVKNVNQQTFILDNETGDKN